MTAPKFAPKSEARSEAGHAKLRMPFALVALYGVIVLISGLAYGISAWQVFGFAHDVWLLPTLLSVFAAIVADLLSLAGAFATYVMRDAPFRVRLYTWAVFFAMTGLSFFAQESFAAHRRISLPARVASGAIVIALAFAIHLLIVVRRHAPTIAPEPEAVDHVHVEKPSVPVTPESPATVEATSVTGTRRGSVARRKRSAVDLRAGLREGYAKRVLAGERAADVAAELGVSRRAVEQWVKAYRESHPADPAKQQVNGHVVVAHNGDTVTLGPTKVTLT